MDIVSKHGGVTVEYLDHGGPDRFVVTGAGGSYLVYAAQPGAVVGDLDAAAMLPAPNDVTSGIVGRFAAVHDPVLAKRHGFPTSWTRFVEVLSSGPLQDGYHPVSGFGTVPATPSESEGPPVFVAVEEDVTEAFVAAATTAAEAASRSLVGEVRQRMVVDVSPWRDWSGDLGDGLRFSCNVFPALDGLSVAERADLAAACGFESADAMAWCFVSPVAQTREEALYQSETFPTFPLSAPWSELVDHFRLHSDPATRAECYDEMFQAAVGQARALADADPVPSARLAMGM